MSSSWAESSTATGASSVTSSTTTASATNTSKPTALPTEEALPILLSPDGYYAYLGIAKPAPASSRSLQYQEAAKSSEPPVDVDQVKKNYRRLSLKHHPDRKTGDAETFRVLTRAKIVLSNAKLRREYELIGLDLEDEAEDEGGHHEEEGGGKGGGTSPEKAAGTSASEAHEDDKGEAKGGKQETVMGHLATATLAVVMQVVVRTLLMGLLSVLVSKYTLLTILAIGGLALLATKMYAALKKSLKPKTNITLSIAKDALSPLVIAFGIFLMYRGRRYVVAPAAASAAAAATEGDADAAASPLGAVEYHDWSWTFLAGEVLVLTCFLANSVDKELQHRLLVGAFAALSLLLSLWLRGRFWRYATLLAFEGVMGMLVVLAFPIMEMILESLVEEKMRKVGEKIRAHDKRMRELSRRKQGQPGS